mmetsp:Transcript_12489/g.26584  ORF Transcript_12489/g.26584 Transcript_12489/m.26584 type:complete len:341 (+) Transcript_12489:63-1085(+)
MQFKNMAIAFISSSPNQRSMTYCDNSPSPRTTLYSVPMNDNIAFADIEEQIRSSSNDNTDNDVERATTSSSPSSNSSLAEARDHIFELGSIVGQMCALFASPAIPRDPIACRERPSRHDHPFWLDRDNSPEKERVAAQLGRVFLQLFAVAAACRIDLRTAILKKVELNGRKYPVDLCKGKSGKYTNYSDQTGITPTKGQSTVNSPVKSTDSSIDEEANEDMATIEGITHFIRNFANERLWNRYHTPRNITLALLGEVGELAELFQWRGDHDNNDDNADGNEDGDAGVNPNGEKRNIEKLLTEEELDKIGQEIADVSIYLLRLADVCHVSLGEVSMQLLEA